MLMDILQPHYGFSVVNYIHGHRVDLFLLFNLEEASISLRWLYPSLYLGYSIVVEMPGLFSTERNIQLLDWRKETLLIWIQAN